MRLDPRQQQGSHENHERWLVSYADFITLMFAFFVVMFASSQTDRAKAKQVSDSVREALEKGGITHVVKEVLGGTVDDVGKGNAMMKGPGGSKKSTAESADPSVIEFLPSLQYLNHELSEEIRLGKVQVSVQPRGLVVSLRQATFFPSGEDRIAPETYEAVGKIAHLLMNMPNPVRLEGHTDSVPINTARFHSNWDLSAARGIAMLELLTTRFGVPMQKLAIAGYADTAPADSNDTEEGRAHNRRVDIVILASHRLTSEPSPAPPPKK